ncbi:MAG: cysteine desulfurase [Bacteriovoracaceae bacterium]|nr:cysteine desulfurase [Bacteriovoracaceae bacterium]
MDIDKIQKDFCQCTNPYEGNVITYFDSAATTLKPKQVVDAVNNYYLAECANVHRGIHTLSEVSTSRFEATRDKLQKLINTNKREEIIFTKGATEALNLVASSYASTFLKEGDEILITEMEHHSNIVPWQIACEKTGATLKAVPVTPEGELDMQAFEQLLTDKTKIMSVVYVSNALGTINPVQEMITKAHAKGAITVIDACQAPAHLALDVQELNCDFMAFSGHKMFGPTGTGVLYGKEDLLNKMPPYQGGGDMIDHVTIEKTTYNVLPHKFEAGTPNIAGVIGLGAAIDYINELGLDEIKAYEDDLLAYATERMSEVPDLTIVGTAKNKASVISFVMKDLHPHDIATLANKYHIALRTGHHCAQPLMKRLNVPATARASLSIYNSKADVDKLVDALKKMVELFS